MTTATIERLFDAAMDRAGLHVPAERRPVMLAAFRDVLAWSELMQAEARPAALEPLNTYDVVRAARSREGG